MGLQLLTAIVIGIVLIGCSGQNKNGAQDEHEHGQMGQSETKYTCPMHPQIVQDSPGTCPICGMDLVPVNKSTNGNNDLMLSETQMRLANVTTQKVSKKPVGQTLVIHARLTVNEEQSEVISSRAAGRVEKLHVKETGRSIKKGEPLYELYSETLLTLQKEYLLAKEQYESLGKTESRYASFLNAAEKKLLLYGLTKQQINKLGQSKALQSRITFLSPASGIVTEINAVEGQYLAEGRPLYRIENISKLWVEAELYPHETEFVKPGDNVTVRIVGFESTPVPAKVTFFSPEYRANTQITVMRAEINNPHFQFKPGMQAQVLLTHSSREALAIPVDAVIRDGKGAHVYVQNGTNTFRPQMVKTGIENFDQIEITEGIQEGDTVAVSGAYLLYSEIVLKKGGSPMAGHQHGNMEDMEGMTENKEATRQTEPNATQEPMDVEPKFSQQLGETLAPYLTIKDALVSSDPEAASAAGKNFASALQKVDMKLVKGSAHTKWMEKLNAMNESSKIIGSSNYIEKQRASFSTLTDALYTSFKTFNVNGLEASYQFCPMAFDNKGAYWISRDKQVSNPYFGEKLLRCGETKETLK